MLFFGLVGFFDFGNFNFFFFFFWGGLVCGEIYISTSSNKQTFYLQTEFEYKSTFVNIS